MNYTPELGPSLTLIMEVVSKTVAALVTLGGLLISIFVKDDDKKRQNKSRAKIIVIALVLAAFVLSAWFAVQAFVNTDSIYPFSENGWTVLENDNTVNENLTQLIEDHDLTRAFEFSYTVDGHTYCAFNKACTWTEANEYCVALNGHLLTITSPQEEEAILSHIDDYKCENYWLGANCENDDRKWRWITEEPFKYASWCEGEPNNSGGTEFYAAVLMDGSRFESSEENGNWNDWANDAGGYYKIIMGFICEWDHEFAD